jgi:acyl-CoA thioester hydrolase
MDRLSISLPEMFHFTTEIQPLTRDINKAGHVGNDILVSYINETLHRFLSANKISIEMTIMADLAIIYKSEAFYGDILKCEAAVEKFTSDSCHFYYRLSNKGKGQEVFRARARVVFFDYKERKRLEIPPALAALMK